MIKVLHVVYGGPGGTGRNILNIAGHYDTSLVQAAVLLVGYRLDPQYVEELTQGRVKGWPLEKKGRWDLGFVSKMRRIIRDFQPDVVLLHTPVAYFWGRLAVLGLGVKQVISVEHLAMESGYGLAGRLLNILQTHLISDEVICISGSVKEYIKKALFLPDCKIQVIENGIPLERCRIRESGTLLTSAPARLIMVARLDGQKEPATLINAIKLLNEQGAKVELSFVGTGELLGQMKELVARLGLLGSVHFLGLRQDVPELLAQADIFVLSTHGEGLPIALLEAMAAGLPCVASAVPGCIGILEEGVSGLLVPENDPQSLAAAISGLLENPESARAMGLRARQVVREKYSIERVVREYQKTFRKLLGVSR